MVRMVEDEFDRTQEDGDERLEDEAGEMQR